MMAELLEAVAFWPSLVLVVVVFGFAPGFCLRLIVLAYPRSDPRREELIAELYAVPRIQRPLWVAQQLEVALFEGLGQRVSAAIRRLIGRPPVPLAYHDTLTGLVNKAMVNQRLAQVFTKRAGQRRVGVCYLDLDEFQAVNDSLEEDAGDQVLKAVASWLTRCCTSGQLVARTGGDEFVIIVEDTAGEHDVAVLAEEILTAMAAPIQVGDHELTVAMSIGVVERPVADTNPTDLLQAADTTLYRAKGDGKGRYAMFDRLAGGDFDQT
jgi:diguanylate cyclase (GGDEF)-like protein